MKKLILLGSMVLVLATGCNKAANVSTTTTTPAVTQQAPTTITSNTTPVAVQTPTTGTKSPTTATTPPTPSLKTYNNTKYNFQLSYPSDWSFVDTTSGQPQTGGAADDFVDSYQFVDSNDTVSEDKNSMYIFVTPNTDNLSLQDWANQEYGVHSDTTISPTEINGSPAVLVSLISGQTQNKTREIHKNAIFMSNGNVIELQGSVDIEIQNDAQIQTVSDKLDAIINSFKFTK